MKATDPLARALELVKLSTKATLQGEPELGQAVADAIHDPTAWQRVHDRLNVMGEYDAADRVRQAVDEEDIMIIPPMPRN
jgi:hypothetical protein